jgi:hypothetical protein
MLPPIDQGRYTAVVGAAAGPAGDTARSLHDFAAAAAAFAPHGTPPAAHALCVRSLEALLPRKRDATAAAAAAGTGTMSGRAGWGYREG